MAGKYTFTNESTLPFTNGRMQNIAEVLRNALACKNLSSKLVTNLKTACQCNVVILTKEDTVQRADDKGN